MLPSLQVFIGYDAREAVAYHVLAHSILRRASRPVTITPLVRAHLAGIHARPRGPLESTDFSLTRFLVPYLSGYRGLSIFMDCDMLCRVDLAEVLTEVVEQPFKSVYVVPHDYTPRTTTKFLGQPQTAYPRKNWSSFMVFDNKLCHALTPEYVDRASGLDLHRFAWMPTERIGFLPLSWNWLVSEYENNEEAKILHYTLGGPWFAEMADCDHAEEWRAERAALLGEEVPCPTPA